MKKQNDDIAIIGMSCAFPGAKDTKMFWKNLQKGMDCITHFGEYAAHSTRSNENKKIHARGVLDKIEYFDSTFFGITTQDAATMDPQHRLFLEKCVEAIDNAGCDLERYEGRVGVFAGAAESSYLTNNLLKNAAFIKTHMSYRTKTLTDPGFLSTRASYLFNLTGPSLNINTACSSGLIAVIYACKALQNNDCDMALSGTVTIQCPQYDAVPYKVGGIFSSDGVCRPFDQKASGTVKANGIGVVALKRLTDAINDHDRIIAVISGFAINNDGHAKAGFTAPSVIQQANCIKSALQSAQIQPSDINYIETHGTATPLGDLLEITALKNVFSIEKLKNKKCVLGAVKANIGHTDMAAGMAGLIKVALSLQYKQFVPTPHYETPHAKLDLNRSVFYVNTKLTDWRISKANQKRRASINSLGIGGTNAHLILEEGPQQKNNRLIQPWYSVILSAHTQESLERYIQNLLAALESDKPALANIAYTLALGRTARKFRKSYIASSIKNLKQQLHNDVKDIVVSPQTIHTVFILSGQYHAFFPSWADIANNPHSIFKSHIDYCVQYLPNTLKDNWKNRPDLASFILEYAYVKGVMDFGIQPAGFVILNESGAQLAKALTEQVTLNTSIKHICDQVISKHHSSCNIMASYTSFEFIQARYQQQGNEKNQIPINDPFVNSNTCICISLTAESRWLDCIINRASKNNCILAFSPNINSMISFENAFYKHLSALLGKCWEHGIVINWSHYFKNEVLQKIELPPTVFQKEKAWIVPSESFNEENREYKTNHFASPYWKIINVEPEVDLTEKKNWVIFANNDLFSQKLIHFLKNYRQTILVITKNSKDAEIYKNDNMASLDLLNPLECETIKNHLSQSMLNINQVVYLWSYEKMDFKKIKMIKNLITLTLPMCQKNKINLQLFSKHMFCLAPSDQLRLENAFLCGFCRVIPQEYPINVRLMDIEENPSDYDALIKRIVAQCLKRSTELMIAHRNNMIFSQRFKPIQILEKRVEIKNNVIILITGGLGRIGLIIAQYFSIHYHAHILLLGRNTDTPSNNTRLYSLENCNGLFDPKTRSVLLDINQNSASLTIAFGDVSDYDYLAEISDTYLKKHSAFDYVFHLSAALKKHGKYGITEFDEEAIITQWCPKIIGLKNLHHLSKHCDMGTIVIFSSIASFIGGASMATYAGVSTVLDAYAELIQAESKTRCLCLNWDAWKFDVSEETSNNTISKKQRNGLDARLAIKLLIKLLNASPLESVPIVISHMDAMKRLVQLDSTKENDNPPISKINKLSIIDKKNILRYIFKESLGIKSIDDNIDFYNYGGDSLLGIDILEKIEKAFAASLDPSFILQNRTIDQINAALNNISAEKKMTIFTMNATGSTPLFLLNPVSGMSTCYVDLAKTLEGKFTCYTIQDLEIDKQSSFSSLEEMANHYVMLIQSIQTTGDYILVGYSLGGSVGHAMTKQLEAAGHQNTQLFIIDGWAAGSEELRSYSRFKKRMQKYTTHIQNAISNPLKTKDLIQQFWYRMQLLLEYKPQTIHGDIHLLKAEKILAEYQAIDDEFNHWQHYTQGKVNVHHLPYDHESMLCLAASEAIATIIQSHLIIKD